MRESISKSWLVWGCLYSVIILGVICVVNYSEPYSPGPVMNPVPWLIILWGFLYLPVIIAPLAAGWKVTDFGFSISILMGLTSLVVLGLCAPITSGATRTSLGSAAIEAFARTGEEVFFRGFLFYIFTRLFEHQRRSWLWAVIGTSILFALAHTQTFQPSFFNQNSSTPTAGIFPIIERLLNVFGVAVVLALLRAWTRSILPSALIHGLLNGGILTLPFILLIYALLVFWAYKRREQIVINTGKVVE